MLRVALVAALVGLAASACSSSAPAPAPAPRTTSVPRTAPPPRVASSTPQTVSFTFTANDASLVRAYYSTQSRGNGNGRGRSGGLPPGIEKNLARGKPLPPGIAKQLLPPDLVVQLSQPPRGFEYVIIAGKLLLVEAATQVVREILLEAVFG